MPWDAPAADVLAASPDGIVLANGPGDPAALPACVEEVRAMLDARPVFGICLGHQLLGRALGLETFKLRFGHRGANHPVLDLGSGRVLVTAQNHGFAVRGPETGRDFTTAFGPGVVTHTSLYDGTVEGLAPARSRRLLAAVPPRGQPRPARRPGGPDRVRRPPRGSRSGRRCLGATTSARSPSSAPARS